MKIEFIDLAKASGWSQAEIARQLKLTRGGVNGIITGPQEPSEALVKLFRLVLVAAKPEVLLAHGYPSATKEIVEGMDPPRVRSASDNLREIHDTDPEAFKEVERVIITYRKAVGKRPANLTAAEKRAAASAPAALKLALHPDQASSLSQKAGAPISYKRRPGRDTGKRSKKQPESPDQAPNES